MFHVYTTHAAKMSGHLQLLQLKITQSMFFFKMLYLCQAGLIFETIAKYGYREYIINVIIYANMLFQKTS